MKTPIAYCARAALVLALGASFAACDDDDAGETSTGAQSDDDSEASGARSVEPERPRASEGGSEEAAAGAGGLLSEGLCVAGATRFAEAAPECVACVCQTIADCGAACQDLLLCTLSQCGEVLGDGARVLGCALENCAEQATSPGALIGLTQAAASLAGCAAVCRPPAAADAGTGVATGDEGGDEGGGETGGDAGVEESADAGR